MSSYPIYRWNPVITGNTIHKTPMISIKPDIAFMEFIRDNHFAVVCEISGTNTIYDQKNIPGIVNSSCCTPSCRPNFCEQTGLYVITLWSNWYGYPEPDKLGTVKFFGMLGQPEQLEPKQPKQLENFKLNDTNGLSEQQIVLISGSFLIVLIIIVCIFKYIK